MSNEIDSQSISLSMIGSTSYLKDDVNVLSGVRWLFRFILVPVVVVIGILLIACCGLYAAVLAIVVFLFMMVELLFAKLTGSRHGNVVQFVMYPGLLILGVLAVVINTAWLPIGGVLVACGGAILYLTCYKIVPTVGPPQTQICTFKIKKDQPCNQPISGERQAQGQKTCELHKRYGSKKPDEELKWYYSILGGPSLMTFYAFHHWRIYIGDEEYMHPD
jgi:hypothetical protein